MSNEWAHQSYPPTPTQSRGSSHPSAHSVHAHRSSAPATVVAAAQGSLAAVATHAALAAIATSITATQLLAGWTTIARLVCCGVKSTLAPHSYGKVAPGGT